MLGHLTCYACGDSWCRDLIDFEVQGYIEEHPELEKRIRSGDVTDVDLGEVLGDGCEDYYQDEAALAESWDEYYDGLGDSECDDLEDEIDRKADLMKHGRI